MNLAFGIIFLWWGAACLYGATHDLGASTPWGMFLALLEKMNAASEGPVVGKSAPNAEGPVVGKMVPRAA